MIKKILVLFALVACSNTPVSGDRRLAKKEIPDFLRKYDSKTYEDVEFYEKIHLKERTYEVKYLKDESEVSLAFDQSGKQIEQEEDVKLDSLPGVLKDRITTYLKENYPGHKILEVERRTDAGQKEFIDVEIRHESSKSGYWEIAFDLGGNFVQREVEDYQYTETLN